MSRLDVGQINGITETVGAVTIPSNQTFNFESESRFHIDNTSALQLPRGTTGQRPASPTPGFLRWNTTDTKLEVYDGFIWRQYGAVPGTTAANPATSAQAILDVAPGSPSGLYWIQPNSWSSPAQIYCEMSLHGGGWMYIMQHQCTNDQGLYDSMLTNQTGAQNHASSDFQGCTAQDGTQYTPLQMWDGLVGSANPTKFYAREIQTAGGTYDESQSYVSSTDGPLFTQTSFRRLFAGQFSNGQFQTGVKVVYNNGASSVTGKIGTTWSSPALATINNGNVDQELYFCNGEDGGDSNWSFALMKGGTPYPRTADATNGGNRHSGITRWAIIAIKP